MKINSAHGGGGKLMNGLIRDIFEKHKLAVPGTYDELHKVLSTIKDKEGMGALMPIRVLL